MKDGRTHLAHKAEHAVDLDTGAIVAVTVQGADHSSELAARLECARTELPNLELLEPRPRAELVPLSERAVAIGNTSEHEGMPNIYLVGWARGVPALAYSHDPDGVVAKHALGAFAGGSFDRLVELAREQWDGRADQAEVAARCIEYLRAQHSEAAVLDRWLAQVLTPAARAGSSTS
jgi:hypothetical protein